MARERYIDFFTDFGFKRLFGSEPNKNLLIDFLNTLLEGKAPHIESIEYMKNEEVGRGEKDRQARYDIKCKADDGTQFIVELQRAKQTYFMDRLVFYSSFPIVEQRRGKDWDYCLPPIYVIGIMDFILFEDIPDKLCHFASIRDDKTYRRLYDKLSFVLLEMPKFKKEAHELNNHFEKWLFAMNNLAKLEDKPSELREAVFEQFFEAAEIAKLTPAEYDNYQSDLKAWLDSLNALRTAHEEGKAEGRAEGKAEGLAEGKAEGRIETLAENVKNLMETFKVSFDEALKALKVSETERERLEKAISSTPKN